MNGKKAKAIRRAAKEQYSEMDEKTRKTYTLKNITRKAKKLYTMGHYGWMRVRTAGRNKTA